MPAFSSSLARSLSLGTCTSCQYFTNSCFRAGRQGSELSLFGLLFQLRTWRGFNRKAGIVPEYGLGLVVISPNDQHVVC